MKNLVKMLNRVKHIFSVLVVLLLFSGCVRTIHEYPTDPSIEFVLSLEINNVTPEEFVVVKPGGESGTSYIVRTQSAGQKNTRFDEPVKLRYVVDLYRVVASNAQFVKREVRLADPAQPIPDNVVFDLEAAEYKVLVWCDYVRESDPYKSWYYNTDDLRNIRYADIEVKDNNDKDVFTNMAHLNFREYYYMSGEHEESVHLTLERPKGRYKCVTTDVGDYLNKEEVSEITSVVTYIQYVAAGYNVEEQKPNYFESTRTYLTTVTTDDLDQNGNLEMCYDYVFVNGKQTNVKINFQFFRGVVTMKNGQLYKEDGTLASDDDRISNWSGVVVPLKRNMETIIEGRLLTASFGSGGIGIDPGFEGEIVIPWE